MHVPARTSWATAHVSPFTYLSNIGLVCVCVFWLVVGFGVPRELNFAWFIALKCGHLHDTIFQGKVRFDVVSLTPSTTSIYTAWSCASCLGTPEPRMISMKNP